MISMLNPCCNSRTIIYRIEHTSEQVYRQESLGSIRSFLVTTYTHMCISYRFGTLESERQRANGLAPLPLVKSASSAKTPQLKPSQLCLRLARRSIIPKRFTKL